MRYEKDSWNKQWSAPCSDDSHKREGHMISMILKHFKSVKDIRDRCAVLPQPGSALHVFLKRAGLPSLALL